MEGGGGPVIRPHPHTDQVEERGGGERKAKKIGVKHREGRLEELQGEDLGEDRRGGGAGKHGRESKEPNCAHDERSTGSMPRQSHTEGGGSVDDCGDPGAEEEKE